MPQKIPISKIVTDAGTQVRAALNESVVADYAEAMADGVKFPPIIVFHDGNRYLVADGFHRVMAALRNGAEQIECDVRKGGKPDALKFALGCNAHHGLRRTNADKRHAVGMALKEFGKFSDTTLAEMCAVNRELVAEVRKIRLLDSSNLPPATRIGKDGKEYRLPPPPMVRRNANSTPHPQSRSPIEAEREEVLAGRMPGSPAGKMPATTLPPPPSQILDGTGWPIPTHLIPLWQRTDEVQEMLTALSRVKGALRSAQENKDKLFAEVNFSSALSQLDQAWTDIKTAKPFAVCPTCQGQLPDKCTLCKGRGLISEHRWNTCIPREDKEFRQRARVAKSQ